MMKLVRVLVLLLTLFTAPTATRAEEGDTHLALSGPLLLVDGSGFWGANATVLYEITPRWWLGGQTGFFYWHKSYPVSSASEWVVPLVPTIYYNLNAISATFHPYVGVGLGAAYVHYSYSPGNGLVDLSDSGVKFEGLLHAGAKFGKRRRFFADIGLGLLDGKFAFAPSIGWLFSL